LVNVCNAFISNLYSPKANNCFEIALPLFRICILERQIIVMKLEIA
jgi:hypothetical protein